MTDRNDMKTHSGGAENSRDGRNLKRYLNSFLKGFSRRKFVKRSVLGGVTLSGLLALKAKRSTAQTDSSLENAPNQAASVSLPPDAPVEYIVIGSGPGGGPLACNLAKAGHKVVLLEAGGEDADDVTSVPYFSGFATENRLISWNYYVRHYRDTEQQKRDSKYVPDQDGVWYPRVGSLGGCAIHNYLVEVYPSNSDWENIVDITGDFSWNPRNMRKYFERFEACRYVEQPNGGINQTRHGFYGWQPTEIPDPAIFAQDPMATRVLKSVFQEVGPPGQSALNAYYNSKLDPNAWPRVLGNREGLFNIPQFMGNGRRYGPRDLIRETRTLLPNNLIVKTHCLVTRILFEGTTAIGVEYLEGEHLYRADPLASSAGPEPGPRQQLLASREVILCAGAFNSPQLLKLSGIGPKAELEEHNIPVIVDLPGVGENLQDRYEVSVITELNEGLAFNYADQCLPTQPDPCSAQWLQGEGVYTTNGTLVANMRKSKTARLLRKEDPDLFIFGTPLPFKGFYPGYSGPLSKVKSQFSWVCLKAHTVNRAGNVKLRSANPQDTPIINFHYFGEGSDTQGEDLNSVADGVEFIRKITQNTQDIASVEIQPGPTVRTRSDILQFVMDEAWGHHASCTNKMGASNDPMAVVDSQFRVYGTENLRIVDASIFPQIPGYFILTPILMISEKASDVILGMGRDSEVVGKAQIFASSAL